MDVNENVAQLPARVTEAPPPIPFADLERMGAVMAKSGLFGIKTQEQAVALMLVSQAEGRHPASVAMDYNIIQNRPALTASAILARFQQAGGVIEWEELNDKAASALFSHPKSCPKPVRVDWNMERAKTAGLSGKDNWRKWPRQMLRSRVVSEGARTALPGCMSGMYSVEEILDMEPAEQTRALKEPPKKRDPLAKQIAAPEKVDTTTGEIQDAEIIPPEPAKTPEQELGLDQPMPKPAIAGINIAQEARIEKGLDSLGLSSHDSADIINQHGGIGGDMATLNENQADDLLKDLRKRYAAKQKESK